MIVAFSGPQGAGKSTAMGALSPWSPDYVDFIEKQGAKIPSDVWVHLPFAGPIKAMLATLIGWEDINDRELREKPYFLLAGKPPRFAMQTLFTEWGREILGKDLWVNAWKQKAREVIKVGAHVVVDDLRFFNEEQAILAMGGCIIEVERPGVQRTKLHASESYTPDYHYHALNNGSPEELHKRVRYLVDLYSDRLNAEDW